MISLEIETTRYRKAQLLLFDMPFYSDYFSYTADNIFSYGYYYLPVDVSYIAVGRVVSLLDRYVCYIIHIGVGFSGVVIDTLNMGLLPDT